MQAIDVVMLTKNSEHMLDRCLRSLYENVPVKNLIVVDGFSTDNTPKLLEEANRRYGNVRVVKANGSRARAREKGIAEVTTDWFLFVDSDVVLCRDWYEKALKNVKSDVGAVWGVNIDVIPTLQDPRFLRAQQLIAEQCFALRGGTHDTLVRTELVKGLKIPQKLHTYEDAFIIKSIKDKGYRAIIGEDIYCVHYKPSGNWSPGNMISGAVEEMRCGLIYSHNFVYMAYYPIFMLNWAVQIAFHGVRGLLPSPSVVQVPPTDGPILDVAKRELRRPR